MENYKENLYSKYHTNHILARKGQTDLPAFKAKVIVWKQTIARFLPADKTAHIIDVGCGDGALLWWLQSLGYAYSEGVDLSQEQVLIAHRLGVDNVRCSDAVSYLKEKRGYYDVVILRDILEHLHKQETMDTLSKCKEALKRGGRVIIQVPNAESPFFGRIRYGDFTHELAFSSASIMQVLRSSGFQSISLYPVSPVVHGLLSGVRFIMWKTIELFYKFLLLVELGHGYRIVTQTMIAVAKSNA